MMYNRCNRGSSASPIYESFENAYAYLGPIVRDCAIYKVHFQSVDQMHQTDLQACIESCL